MIVTSYTFIDASTEGYEEEEVFYEEEEGHFDQYSNQGKLLPMQALLMQSARYSCHILLFKNFVQTQVFILQSFTLFTKAIFL